MSFRAASRSPGLAQALASSTLAPYSRHGLAQSNTIFHDPGPSLLQQCSITIPGSVLVEQLVSVLVRSHAHLRARFSTWVLLNGTWPAHGRRPMAFSHGLRPMAFGLEPKAHGLRPWAKSPDRFFGGKHFQKFDLDKTQCCFLYV